MGNDKIEKFKYPDKNNLYNIVIEAPTKEIADKVYAGLPHKEEVKIGLTTKELADGLTKLAKTLNK